MSIFFYAQGRPLISTWEGEQVKHVLSTTSSSWWMLDGATPDLIPLEMVFDQVRNVELQLGTLSR